MMKKCETCDFFQGRQKGHCYMFRVEPEGDCLRYQNEVAKRENKGRVAAKEILQKAASHMENRAATYDKPDGERSMGKTVAAFNAITGHALTEEQGWLLMGLLKMARSQQGAFKIDNYEDESAYAALRGECAAKERGKGLDK